MSVTANITRLANGLRVVTNSMPQIQTAAVGVWVDSGARSESEQLHGVSHMLEHMAFKGTRRRSARAIAEEIEAVGGHLNAYTGREQTAYFVRILKNDLPLAVDLLADILQESVFDSEELAREQDVIIQEIGQALDTPDDLVFEMMQAEAYPDQPMGRSILGTEETVGGFTPDILRGHMGRNYRAPSMILSAAGAVDHAMLVAMAQEKFGNLGPALPKNIQPALWQGGDTREEKDLEQAHLVLALEGVAYGDPDYYTAQVFSTVLGGGMSSRLFQEVREKRGLCYSIYSFTGSHRDSGMLGIYAGSGAERLNELVKVIAGEVQSMTGKVSENETARGRAQLKAGLLMSLESPSAQCEQMARQLLIYGRVLTTEELVQRVDAVDAAALQRFASRLLSAAKLTLSALGPVKSLESGDKIAARFAS